MNESELKQYCLEHAGEGLSAEARALLDKDPELKKQVEQLITVQKLISLKRYEAPAHGSVDRCIRGVNEEISKRRLSLPVIVREWMEFEPAAVRYACAAAALVICAIGVSVLTTRDSLNIDVAAQKDPSAELRAAPEPVVLTPERIELEEEFATSDIETNPVFQKPIIVLRSSSNVPSSSPGMTIGGGQVMPVSFER